MTKTEVYKCDVCGKECDWEDLHQLHIYLEWEPQNEAIDVCPACLAKRPYLDAHLHGDDMPLSFVLDALNEVVHLKVTQFIRRFLKGEDEK